MSAFSFSSVAAGRGEEAAGEGDAARAEEERAEAAARDGDAASAEEEIPGAVGVAAAESDTGGCDALLNGSEVGWKTNRASVNERGKKQVDRSKEISAYA